MSKANTKPCIRCAARDRTPRGDCRPCAQRLGKLRRKNYDKKKRNARERANYAANPLARVAKKAGHDAWKAANKEKVAQYQKEWQKANPARVRDASLKKYGISTADYEHQFAAQSGVCAICKKQETSIDSRTGQTRALAVDHCHTTGRPRGLLCRRCNTGLGHFLDDLVLLEQAVAYLKTM
jgi:hypothetical protein